MPIKTIFIICLFFVWQTACVGFNASFNNIWKVPGTKLEIAVEKQKSSLTDKTVERKIVLREEFSDKNNYKLARTANQYSRLNVYQTAENVFLIRDSFETYELNTQAKTLLKIAPPTVTDHQKFIGSFDDNENGNWRFIPVAERGEIPLGTQK